MTQTEHIFDARPGQHWMTPQVTSKLVASASEPSPVVHLNYYDN